MTERLRLTIDFDLPADLFERSDFITRIGVPIGEARAVLSQIVGAPVEIKHEILSDAPAASPVKRGRGPNKPKAEVMPMVSRGDVAKAQAA